MKRYYGKYRGLVINNLDANRMGKLQVMCPLVLGENVLAWAMPCVPFAGFGEGFYMLPNIGSNVWVEFEAGDPDQPIWSGCFWTQQMIPPAAALPTVRTIKTLGAELTLDDTPGSGGIRLMLTPPTVTTPCLIQMNAVGILINTGAGTIKVDPKSVDLNFGALTVM